MDVQNWRYDKSYVARSYHKRVNLTNETYVGQLKNIMGPPIPGRGVPRIDVFFLLEMINIFNQKSCLNFWQNLSLQGEALTASSGGLNRGFRPTPDSGEPYRWFAPTAEKIHHILKVR